MSTTLSDIQEKISQLEAKTAKLREEAAAERQKVVAGVVQEIRAKIAEYGLTARDLGLAAGASTKPKRKTTSSAPSGPSAESGTLYRSPTGETWTGGTRGRKPRWLTEALADGKQLSDFAAA